jgi:hypothetical protein
LRIQYTGPEGGREFHGNHHRWAALRKIEESGWVFCAESLLLRVLDQYVFAGVNHSRRRSQP